MLTTALIVDDHPAMIIALKSIMFKIVSLRVIDSACDGASCLHLCEKLKPSIVILDLDLPDMDGFDVIRRIKARKENTKILIYTSLDERVYGHRVREVGAHGYVNKASSNKVFLHACSVLSNGFCFYSISSMDYINATKNKHLSSLSQREFQVLKHLGKGLGNHEISETLNISHKTVSTYKMRLFDKLGVENMADLILFCREHRVCDL